MRWWLALKPCVLEHAAPFLPSRVHDRLPASVGATAHNPLPATHVNCSSPLCQTALVILCQASGKQQ